LIILILIIRYHDDYYNLFVREILRIFYMIKIFLWILFIIGILIYNIILRFYVTLRCMIRNLLPLFYNITNDEYIIIMRRCFMDLISIRFMFIFQSIRFMFNDSNRND